MGALNFKGMFHAPSRPQSYVIQLNLSHIMNSQELKNLETSLKLGAFQ